METVDKRSGFLFEVFDGQETRRGCTVRSLSYQSVHKGVYDQEHCRWIGVIRVPGLEFGRHYTACFCAKNFSRGIQLLSSIVANQLVTTPSARSISHLGTTSKWKPSSQRMPRRQKGRDGTLVNSSDGLWTSREAQGRVSVAFPRN